MAQVFNSLASRGVKPSVVVLAAGSIRQRLGFVRSAFDSPALTPVGQKTAIAHLLDFYTRHGLTLTIAINKEDLEQISSELCHFASRINLIPVDSDSVVGTLERTIVDAGLSGPVIVNVVTTIPTRLLCLNEVLLAAPAERSPYWSSINLEADEPIFQSKQSGMPIPGHAFTGVFCATAESVLIGCRISENRSDLLSVVKAIHTTQSALSYVCDDWIDIGHDINYFDARNRLIVSRSFNTIEVQVPNGVLVKRSPNAGEKLAREIEYSLALPADVAIYFPRVIQVPEGTQGGSQAVLEYYGYPCVAELLLFWRLSSAEWDRLYGSLEKVLAAFAKYRASISPESYERFYLGKLAARLEQFYSRLSNSTHQLLTSENLRINGDNVQPLSRLWDRVAARVRALYRESDFCIMHGDFCFGNILYDPYTGVVRLIDARGSFDDETTSIFGDRKYDLCKLYHSACGKYDYFIADLFACSTGSNTIDVSFVERPWQQDVSDGCIRLLSRLGYREEDIQFLASLLFLSMTPLHSESEERQIGMYAHGLRMLNRALAES